MLFLAMCFCAFLWLKSFLSLRLCGLLLPIVKLVGLIFIICSFACVTVFAQPPSIAWRNIWVSEYEPNDSEKALLAPSIEIEQQFADFLRLPDTGLIRMY